MADLTPSRDRLYQLLTEIRSSQHPNIVNILTAVVEELHQLAGVTNQALSRVEASVTDVDRRLTDLQVTVGIGVEDEEPQHSDVPSMESFKAARAAARKKD